MFNNGKESTKKVRRRYNPAMPELNLPAPQWIATPAALRRMVQDLSHCTQVAVDTESNGLHAYQEQVCLLQFSTGSVDYLVDPLALDDLSPVGPIFADPGIEIIFHAAEYDILCLKRDFGFRFSRLFDTMAASRILSKKDFGLGAVLENEFGVKLDKRYQRSNWARRPLPEVMQSYARLDSHYLIELRDRLHGELAEKGLLALADEDFHRLMNTPAAPLEVEPPTCWKVSGKHDLDPQQAAVLQALCDFRDQQARYSNLPPFRILPDEVLVELARTCPQTLESLADTPGLTSKAFDRYGISLLDALELGHRSRPIYPPRSAPRPSQAYLHRMDALRQWRKDLGRQLDVESDVVMPRDLLEDLCEVNPRSPQELAQVMADYPWRLEKFGGQILQILDQRGKRQ
jgi:ribonuclease D